MLEQKIEEKSINSDAPVLNNFFNLILTDSDGRSSHFFRVNKRKQTTNLFLCISYSFIHSFICQRVIRYVFTILINIIYLQKTFGFTFVQNLNAKQQLRFVQTLIRNLVNLSENVVKIYGIRKSCFFISKRFFYPGSE